MARKSYHRNFRKNGRIFLVQNCYRADRKEPSDNYFLTMLKDGVFQIVHDPYGEMPKFETIREAQNYAWSCGEHIDNQVW